MKKKKQKHLHRDLEKKFGIESLGYMSGKRWREDPRGLLFSLSRYKFVSKLLSGKKNVLEVGCGDGWFSRIVKQSVKNLTLSDIDEVFLNSAKLREINWKFKFLKHNMMKGPSKIKYDAIYLLDVFEHIKKKDEYIFLTNLKKSLNETGILITGTPSLESQKYVKNPDPTHYNCKTKKNLQTTLGKFFHNVFIFSMNDEVVHTGHEKMSNYFISLCVNKKK